MKTNASSRGSGWMEVEVKPFWSVGKAGEGMRIADADLTNKESVGGVSCGVFSVGVRAVDGYAPAVKEGWLTHGSSAQR